jgi:hypothetical protein
MILSTILTSPTVRVYNLRFLLLMNIPHMVLFGLSLPSYGSYSASRRASLVLGFSCSIVIYVHHILAYAAIQVSLDLVAHGVQRIQMADARSGRDRFGDRCD